MKTLNSENTLIFHALDCLVNLIGVCFQELANYRENVCSQEKYHVSFDYQIAFIGIKLCNKRKVSDFFSRGSVGSKSP